MSMSKRDIQNDKPTKIFCHIERNHSQNGLDGIFDDLFDVNMRYTKCHSNELAAKRNLLSQKMESRLEMWEDNCLGQVNNMGTNNI